MKKITPLYVFLFNILFLFIVLIIYQSSVTKIDEYKLEYTNIKKLSIAYKSKKDRLYTKGKVKIEIKKILKKLHMKKISLKESEGKLIITLLDNRWNKQNQFLNKVLNEKFIISKMKIKNKNIFLEIGLK